MGKKLHSQSVDCGFKPQWVIDQDQGHNLTTFFDLKLATVSGTFGKRGCSLIVAQIDLGIVK